MRLTPPGFERILQSPLFNATFGGTEANVAVSLASFGVPTALITILPASNPIADAAVAEMRKFGVDVNRVIRGSGRMGIYFLETGANERPGKVFYDRERTAIAIASPQCIDWNSALEGANWFHITGITPSISESAACLTLDSVRTARTRHITVSCDLNYRKNLWKWGKAAREVMPEITKQVDVLIANEEDIQLSLGIGNEVEVHAGALDTSRYEHLTGCLLSAYPNLRVVAVTLRESHSASHNDWSACVRSHSGFYLSRKYEIKNIVDRVGAGDSFSAGLIYGMQRLQNETEALEFAVAASCLKHSIPGDFNRMSIDEVNGLLENGGSGRVQR